MASSSKSINMPLMFAVSIGAAVSLLAITMFGLAWYEYEKRVVLNDQVIDTPTHTDEYNQALEAQQANRGGIDEAIQAVADAQAGDGHDGHNAGQ